MVQPQDPLYFRLPSDTREKLMPNPQPDELASLIRRRLPSLRFSQARLVPATGQFNTVLCLDKRWIFRFPKSEHAAVDLAHELRILPRLQGRLPLPVPEPRYRALDADGRVLFMGYARLPGEPLLRPRFERLRHRADIVERIAGDLSDFLLALHRIPPDELGLEASAANARDAWAAYFAAIRQGLYPYMRSEARREVSRDFELALEDKRLWQYKSCLTHGDFGTGNILYRDGRISGIIDFSFCGYGDPAQDLGALLASYGMDFAELILARYPALRAQLPRARFYRRQYALLQALFALRDGDRAEFDDGISAYL